MRALESGRAGAKERREHVMGALRKKEAPGHLGVVFKMQHEVRAASGQARGDLSSMERSLTGAGAHSAEIASVRSELSDVDEQIQKVEKEAEGLLEQLLAKETEQARREKIVESCGKVIKKILKWSAENGIEIRHVKKLGGGFVNTVLMFTTPEGESFVAKAFVDEGQARVTQESQRALNALAARDEVFVPEALAWVDDSTLISESVEGEPIRNLLAAAHESAGSRRAAVAAFESLGRTLGSIHERTEESVGGERAPDASRVDVEKLVRHFDGYLGSGLFDISNGDAEKLRERVHSMKDGGYVSLIHGDAHLDQFFRVEDRSVVTIVDTDTVHRGDPMADVARSLASLRDWGHKARVPERLIREMEGALMRGYRASRVESGADPESEFSHRRIFVYELRLSLVQLWNYNDLRSRIREKTSIPEPAFYQRVGDNKVSDEEWSRMRLSEKDRASLEDLVAVWKTATEIIGFINGIED